MKTISTLIKKGSDMLLTYNIESSYLDSEIIMQHVLKVEKSFIIMNHSSYVSPKKEKLFWKLVKKRSKKYPVSQIIGNREFWSKNFVVNRHVLDPRPYSETIISTVLKYYPNKIQKLKIADLGTGTGCLLISLLTEYKNAIGIGFEKSFKAYKISCRNLKIHNLCNRAKIFPISWTKCRSLFDLIISNPPYIKSNKLKKLQEEVQKEPKIALDGGNDGLTSYLSIFPILKKCLKKKAYSVLEIGEDQNNIHKIIPLYGLSFQKYIYDLSGMKRCILLKKQ